MLSCGSANLDGNTQMRIGWLRPWYVYVPGPQPSEIFGRDKMIATTFLPDKEILCFQNVFENPGGDNCLVSSLFAGLKRTEYTSKIRKANHFLLETSFLSAYLKYHETAKPQVLRRHHFGTDSLLHATLTVLEFFL